MGKNRFREVLRLVSVTQQMELILSDYEVRGVSWHGMMMVMVVVRRVTVLNSMFQTCSKRRGLNWDSEFRGPINLDEKKCYIFH